MKFGSPVINGKLKNLATDFTDSHGLKKKISEIREICG